MITKQPSNISSRNRYTFLIPFLFLSLLLMYSCTPGEQSRNIDWDTLQDSTDIVAKAEGLDGPESVRYDPESDRYFVSNFTGGGNERDANGFISRLTPDAGIDSLKFMTGTQEYPLHAPRGMYITGDTLWAVDIDGVHGFDRNTGKQLHFVDFTNHNIGFLNDIAEGPGGSLYITDTGTSVLYKINKDRTGAAVVADSLPHPPNGISLDPAGNVLLLAPWGGGREVHAWNPGENTLVNFIEMEGGGNFDGIEVVGDKFLISSQKDSSIHLVSPPKITRHIAVPGKPADIGYDTQRNRVAVPYIARNRVDIWELPEN